MLSSAARKSKSNMKSVAGSVFGVGLLCLMCSSVAAEIPAGAETGQRPVTAKPTPVEYLEWDRRSQMLYTTGRYNGLGTWIFAIQGQTKLAGCVLTQLERMDHHANSLAVGSKRSTVVTGTNVGEVHVRDGQTLSVKKSFHVGKPYSVYAVAIDAEEKQIAACGTDGSVFIWNIDGVKPVHHLQPASREGERMASLAFSPDGKFLAVLSRYGFLSLWDLTSGQRLGEPVEAAGGESSVLQFTPSGERIVVVERAAISFWHPVHEPAVRLIRPPEEVCPRYPPDGEFNGSRPEFGDGIRFAGVASLSRDATRVAQILENGGLAIWELKTKKVLQTLPPPDFVTNADFPGMRFGFIRYSPDSRRVAASASTGELAVWQLP